MPVIATKPHVLRDVDLEIKIGAAIADNYKGHVSTARFDPSVSQVQWRGMSPTAKYTAQSDPTWTLTLQVLQDWETVGSLAQYLLTNAGAEATVTFRHKSGTGALFTATIILAPPAIGGDVETVPTSAVTMGVVGIPVKS